MNRSWNFRRGVLLALAGYTAFLVFAAPQRCADALQAGLRLCGGPLLVSLFPFLIVSALAAGCGAGQWLGFVFRPAARLMGIRAKGAGGVLLIGALGGFAPAAVAASEAVRTGQLTSRQASALLPACVCSGPSFVILTVGQQMLGSSAHRPADRAGAAVSRRTHRRRGDRQRRFQHHTVGYWQRIGGAGSPDRERPAHQPVLGLSFGIGHANRRPSDPWAGPLLAAAQRAGSTAHPAGCRAVCPQLSGLL